MGPEENPLASNPPKEDMRSSSEIKRDIRRTRGRLDNTLENLNERLSPRSLVNDVLDWFESRGGSGPSQSMYRGYRNVVRHVKENPIPAALVGVGIAWLILGLENDEPARLRDRLPHPDDDLPVPGSPGAGATTQERMELSGLVSRAKEKAGEAHEAISGATEAVTEKISEIGSSVQANVRSTASAVSQAVREGSRTRTDATQHLQKGYAYAGDKFQQAVEEYPLGVSIGFLGLGLLTGLLLPKTRQEDRLLGEKSDQLIEQVKETGKETLDKAKAVAQRVSKSAMDEAKRQGITQEAAGDIISDIADKASAVATEAKREATRAAGQEHLKPTAGGTERTRQTEKKGEHESP